MIILMEFYCVNIFLGFYPMFGEADSWENLLHVGVVSLIMEILGTAQFTASFAISMSVFDKRLSSFHLTLLASLSNSCSLVHKTYIFYVIEEFGLFKP